MVYIVIRGSFNRSYIAVKKGQIFEILKVLKWQEHSQASLKHSKNLRSVYEYGSNKRTAVNTAQSLDTTIRTRRMPVLHM